MSTTLSEPPAMEIQVTTSSQETSFSEQLRQTMLAIRLSFTWFGVRKTLSAEHKARAADSFGASHAFLSAGKKLLDTREPTFRAVTSVRNKAVQFLKHSSLPFPESGIRLIRRPDLQRITDTLETYQANLNGAVGQLDNQFNELKSAARERLGELYSPADYPTSLLGQFSMAWEFPSVEPPPYLRQLSPELYQQETTRARARFDEAVRLAEATFTEELAQMVDHLAERLSGTDDGKPKTFRDTAVENLQAFFQRFQSLNIGSNEQLDELVQQSHGILSGVAPQQLRDSPSLRQRITTQLAGVQNTLDGLMVDRPRRNIQRRRPR